MLPRDRRLPELDRISEPERYYFRGPLSWAIRTYSRFMRLPATYSSQGSHFTREGGSWSDGTTRRPMSWRTAVISTTPGP